MAGTIPLSMTQQFDVYGQPLAGGQLYIIQAGTVSTPQDAFQDFNLSIKMPYPIVLDAAGRVPQFFLADGYVKVRLQDAHGVVQLSAETVLVIGPSSGGSGPGTTVDPNGLIQTGNMILRYGVGKIGGYVRANGLTIGNHASATEFDDPSTQALFQYLWNLNDPTLVVLPSRGASASLDFANGRQLTLPDFRGCVPSGTDDMGNSPAGRLTTSFFGAVATGAAALGAMGGIEGRILAQNQLPNIVPTFTGTQATVSVVAGDLSVVYGTISPPGNSQSGGNGTATGSNFRNGNVGLASSGNFTPAGAISSINGNATQTGLVTLGPRKLLTFYLRL
jgi:hypothetical protein